MSVDVSAVEWGTPPPPAASNKRTGTLTPVQIVVMAKMRPGEWGCLPVPSSGHAARFSHKLRTDGIESVSRGNDVYFRATDGGDADG